MSAKKSDNNGGSDDLQLKTLQAENASLKEEMQKMLEEEGSPEMDRVKELAARAQADLQNAKGRMEKEGVEIRMFAVEALLMKLIPTIDNFQRAFAHLPEDLQDHEWVKGVSVVEQELIRQMSEVGLTKIESLGQKVDAEKHEVLQMGEGEKDTVIEVLEDGYELHGKVLRPAKVKVGNG